jgi:hypothetical protein
LSADFEQDDFRKMEKVFAREWEGTLWLLEWTKFVPPGGIGGRGPEVINTEHGVNCLCTAVSSPITIRQV